MLTTKKAATANSKHFVPIILIVFPGIPAYFLINLSCIFLLCLLSKI